MRFTICNLTCTAPCIIALHEHEQTAAAARLDSLLRDFLAASENGSRRCSGGGKSRTYDRAAGVDRGEIFRDRGESWRRLHETVIGRCIFGWLISSRVSAATESVSLCERMKKIDCRCRTLKV